MELCVSIYYLKKAFNLKLESISYFLTVGNDVYAMKGSGGGLVGSWLPIFLYNRSNNFLAFLHQGSAQ